MDTPREIQLSTLASDIAALNNNEPPHPVPVTVTILGESRESSQEETDQKSNQRPQSRVLMTTLISLLTLALLTGVGYLLYQNFGQPTIQTL